MMLVCKPVFMGDAPKEYQNPTMQKCPHCELLIWTSDVKKQILKDNPENSILGCYFCLAKIHNQMGNPYDIVDISNVKGGVN